MISTETLFSAMKVSMWEEAKGKLRALVGIRGATHFSEDIPDEDGKHAYQRTEEAVEAFILEIENNGLHE